jgi:hypothetical protein
MTNPTYSVLAGDPRFRAIVAGAGSPAFVPSPDGSALLREWDRAGYRYLSLPLAKMLGAIVAVVKNPGDVFDLARELGRDPDAES